MNFKIRHHNQADLPFMFSTWLKGLCYGNSWFSDILPAIYFKFYHRVIERILERPNIEISVACITDDDDVILGYSVFEGDTVHWVFVKESWRRMGIGKALLPIEIKTCTHITNLGNSLRKKKGMDFNPFIETIGDLQK